MIINFKKVKLYNFCSYKDTTLDLNNKGFCVVSGKNNCNLDNAISNGSGKSTIWSAICYALTGETISGIKSNLMNINTADQIGFVELYIKVDNDDYEITRTFSPKSDLKIIKNNVDISGKGIRESESILSKCLPDLTKDLIASTIIIGQGMPNKFSSFSPSGRKDLLEKLTKSDFMIDDIKSRLTVRLTSLTEQLRIQEDSLLVTNTKLSSIKNSLLEAEMSLRNVESKNFDELITNSSIKLNSIIAKIQENEEIIANYDTETDKLNTRFISLTAEKSEESDEEFKCYNEVFSVQGEQYIKTKTELNLLKTEINNLESIKDICPTCKQKIPGILKPDTSVQRSKSQKLEESLAIIVKKQEDIKEKHKIYVTQIDNKYSELNVIQQKLKDIRVKYSEIKLLLSSLRSQQDIENSVYNKLVCDKEAVVNIHRSLSDKILTYKNDINQLENNIKIMAAEKESIASHIAVVKKIESLIKREFRGYLLYNIIAFLDDKIKDYSEIVFNTRELSIKLNGNSIDISYCNKLYESLSGGEQQRVDIIVQFAIRDLLQKYFNYSSNILVLDEITDNLDKIATNKIFDLITNNLIDVESIFIISHHDEELALPVDTTLLVTKTELGISDVFEI